jgi:uncharacterized protein YifN (PemK superfamily)
MCQFDGIAPEMVKVRPAIILARNRQNNQLVTVVPISTTAPNPAMPYHHQLTVNPLPVKPGQQAPLCWAKCDMVETVALHRLDRIKDGKNPDGSRRYIVPALPAADITAVQAGVKLALGLP